MEKEQINQTKTQHFMVTQQFDLASKTVKMSLCIVL